MTHTYFKKLMWVFLSTTLFLARGAAYSDTFLQEQIRASIKTFQLMRNDVGVYADAVKFKNPQNHPCSVASVGMGLVSICIADALDLVTDGDAQAEQTLNAMLGNIPSFSPARNPVNGFFRHWINMKTGDRAWNSEYSSIDSAILVAGALFCKSYFSESGSIAALADALFLSIDWSAAIASITTGELYMTFLENGTGSLSTRPFNEYMIVAWLAKHDTRSDKRAEALWTHFYETPERLPKKSYADYELLTDNTSHYLSNFVIQFPYYLCHHFSTSPEYLDYLKNAKDADKQWFQDNTDAADYIWGSGAGPTPDGYNADSFSNNAAKIASPHIIAGFLPIFPEGLADLEALWNEGLGVYQIPDAEKTKLLWRIRISKPEWRADAVAGVDWSTMVFGLAAHPDLLGISFFEKHNQFTFPQEAAVENRSNESPILPDTPYLQSNYPNPFNPSTTIAYVLPHACEVSIRILDQTGREVKTILQTFQSAGNHTLTWDGRDGNQNSVPSGLYVCRFYAEDQRDQQKMLLIR